MTNSSALVISLDFELLWGVFDKVNHSDSELYFQNTRKVIPELLKLFEGYEIHVTWATVGMLFNKNWGEWRQNIPNTLPHYRNTKLSAYQYSSNFEHQIDERLVFASDIIDEIKITPNQEIGTHTYCHYYCLEPGQEKLAFEADLKKCMKLAEQRGLKLRSLVFPRNQYNSEYLNICAENGITGVRTNPDNWYWDDTQDSNLQKKIFRSADAYLGKTDKSYKISEIQNFQNKITLQKASRFLRPRSKYFKSQRLTRIKKELTFAAKNNEVYHLWWHPHNFGNSPEESLLELKQILDHFKDLETNHFMKSLTMNEISSTLLDSTDV